MLYESANSMLPNRTQPNPTEVTRPNPTEVTRPNPTEPNRVESVDWALVYRISSVLIASSAAGWCICSPMHYLHLPKYIFVQIAFNDLPLISMAIAFALTVALFHQNQPINVIALVGAVACALVI